MRKIGGFLFIYIFLIERYCNTTQGVCLRNVPGIVTCNTTPARRGRRTVLTKLRKRALALKAAPAAPDPNTNPSMDGMVNTPRTLVVTTRSSATATFPRQTLVRVTHVDNVVGAQQNTARPRAISGGLSGNRSTGKANRGVRNRITLIP